MESSMFVCPVCRMGLQAEDGRFVCASCRRDYQSDDGIPLLFWPNEWTDTAKDVTESIRHFYEKTPFPNYDDVDSAETLKRKAKRNVFADLLDEQMPIHATILEAGCGTGQLSNLLAIPAGRKVFGTDICLNSLRLGQRFKANNQIDNATYLQMNLFRPVFPPESFDFVISTGVLHHTSNPFLGFQTLTRLVKPGGFIVIGLYHAYGRISTNIRRRVFSLTGDRFKFLDTRLRNPKFSELKKHTWFMDQYKNPHESQHTIREVRQWFSKCGITFVNSIPNAEGFALLTERRPLFVEQAGGPSERDHLRADLIALAKGRSEGGFFIMIGRKPAAPARA